MFNLDFLQELAELHLNRTKKPVQGSEPLHTSVEENDWIIYAVENKTSPTVNPLSPDLVSIGYAVDSYIATYLEPKLPGSLSDTEKEVLRARLVFFLQRYYGVEREKFSRS